MKKLLCALLCVILLFLSVPAAAYAGRGYSTVSNTGVELVYPSDRYWLDTTLAAVVKASRSNGSIYFMPMPKAGNGYLGSVSNGTKVTILAEKSGYYFFETADGCVGWNGKKYFTVLGTSAECGWDYNDWDGASGGRGSDSWTLWFDNGATLEIPSELRSKSTYRSRGGEYTEYHFMWEKYDMDVVFTEYNAGKYFKTGQEMMNSVYDETLRTHGMNVTDCDLGKNSFWLGSFAGIEDEIYVYVKGFCSKNAAYVLEFWFPTEFMNECFDLIDEVVDGFSR